MREIKESKYILDMLGNKVTVGQTVVTNTKDYAHLSVGEVTSVADQSVLVKYDCGKEKRCRQGQFVLVGMINNSNIYR